MNNIMKIKKKLMKILKKNRQRLITEIKNYNSFLKKKKFFFNLEKSQFLNNVKG